MKMQITLLTISALSALLLGCDKTEQEASNQPVQGQAPQYQQPAQGQAPQYQQQAQGQAPQYQQPAQGQAPQYQQPVQGQAPQYQQPVQAQAPQYQQPASNTSQVASAQALPPKPKPATRRTTEEVTRSRASVLTQYGTRVVVRSSPSLKGRKIGHLYDGEEVWVVGITNNCEVINNIQGCWVKVMDAQQLVGYSFDGYLQY